MLGDYARRRLAGRFGADAEVENAAVRAWIFAGRAILDLVLGRLPPPRWPTCAPPATTGSAARRSCCATGSRLPRSCAEGEQALLAAHRALDSIVESAPTMGIALLSVGACTDFFVARAEAAAGQPRATPACALRAWPAGQAQLCRQDPHLRAAGRADLCAPGAAGRAHRPRAAWCAQALAQAERLELLLEQALAHLALAGIAGGEAEALHRAQAAAILQRLGVVAWLARPRGDRDRTNGRGAGRSLAIQQGGSTWRRRRSRSWAAAWRA